jgi:thiamine biosynthesis lipoprotein
MIDSVTFPLMGTDVRIVASPGGISDAAELLRDYDRRLSRFRPDSELSGLNADPRAVVPASPLLRAAVGAALDAARVTGGLVDPTVLPQLEAAGYHTSWDAARGIPLADALAELPPAAPAAPDPSGRWREVRVDDAARAIARPPGLRLDTGGSGKGHAADLVAEILAAEPSWAVSCGGDLRIGGRARRPRSVRIADPFGSPRPLATLQVRHGALATSGISARLWRRPDGGVAHHLIDPATGEPAFSGLVQVTARARSAAHAEALAKSALLLGADAARRILAPDGGLFVDARGQVTRVGALAPRPVVRMRRGVSGLQLARPRR